MKNTYIVLTVIEEGNLIPMTVPIDSFWFSIASKGGCHIHFFQNNQTIKVNEPFNYIVEILQKDGNTVHLLPEDEEE